MDLRKCVRAALALTATLGTAACSTDDVSTQLTGPGGTDSSAFAVTLGGAAGLPSGTFFVASPADLWNRGTGLLGFFNSANAFSFPAWVFEGKLRNAAEDTRAPTLASSTVAWSRWAVMGTASFSGVANSYDLYAEVAGLEPSTDYTVMLVRYGLQVNDRLDAVNVLSGRAADAADSLFLLGGSPAGTPDYPCDFTTAAAPTVMPDANPFVLGYITSGAGGGAVIDCVIHAGDIWDADDNTIAADQSVIPFGGNHSAAFDLPAYNYLVLVEGKGTAGAPVPAGAAAARVQMGVDLDADGNPIPNALGPFPLEEEPPATLAELRFMNATPLEAGQVFAFWAVDTETGETVRLVGDFARIDPAGDTTEAALMVSEIQGGGGVGDLNVFTVSTATTDLDPSLYDRILVSIVNAGAAAPGDVVFLRGDFGSVPAQGNATFGHGFSYGGSGTAFFFGDELRINLRNLPRPPTGFFYEVWLVNEATGNALSLGEIRTPFPDYASLRDADMTMAEGALIPSASLRVLQTDLSAQFADFTSVRVTLSPKVRSGVPLNVAMQAEIPEEAVDGES